MSSNTIRARMDFSFKAESYELDASIDLDRCLGDSDEAPNFHLLLAKSAGIDTYSYLYEVLESHDIVFSEATGVAAQSCRDGAFDWFRFARDAHDADDLDVVRAIAESTMGVADLDGRAELKAALLAAYRAGKAHGAA
jgi:hypothetical protein